MALLGLGHHRRAASPRRDAREAGAGEGERSRAGEGEHLLVVVMGCWQFGLKNSLSVPSRICLLSPICD